VFRHTNGGQVSASSILKASFVTEPCLRPQSRKDGFFIKPANFVCGISVEGAGGVFNLQLTVDDLELAVEI